MQIEYMEMLAQGGHIIAKYAQLTFQNAIEVKEETIDAVIAETKKHLLLQWIFIMLTRNFLKMNFTL